ncbi:unnamed protein product [Bursaphelenchus okinawaensis]|uniref:Uncharacterized protein n=1 Tax=Bursaphelenchus okinawaensis TaxID=465554 RepID=A0A811KNR4_9BILA|nr:unnamed protein product [Bursaphelenchus okinawaensis]CAG9106882.1 unnamed protein product [Bursaphelenchus okinawaensis]
MELLEVDNELSQLSRSGSFRQQRRPCVDAMITLYEQLQLQQIQANSAMSSSSHAQAIQTIKCVVEGDRRVGRSSLLKVYTGEMDESCFDEPVCSSENAHKWSVNTYPSRKGSEGLVENGGEDCLNESLTNAENGYNNLQTITNSSNHVQFEEVNKTSSTNNENQSSNSLKASSNSPQSTSPLIKSLQVRTTSPNSSITEVPTSTSVQKGLKNPQNTSALRNFSAELRMDGRPIYLIMHETEAGSDFDHLRRLHYAETDCFVLCFSVVKPETFESIRNFWYMEVIEHCQKWPTIILVGTMVDLREDIDIINDLQERGKQPITCEQGLRLAKDIKAARYLECSAKTKVGVSTVFHEAVRAVLAPPEIPSGTKLPKALQDDWNCSIM